MKSERKIHQKAPHRNEHNSGVCVPCMNPPENCCFSIQEINSFAWDLLLPILLDGFLWLLGAADHRGAEEGGYNRQNVGKALVLDQPAKLFGS